MNKAEAVEALQDKGYVPDCRKYNNDDVVLVKHEGLVNVKVVVKCEHMANGDEVVTLVVIHMDPFKAEMGRMTVDGTMVEFTINALWN